jgi:hypothetical protein
MAKMSFKMTSQYLRKQVFAGRFTQYGIHSYDDVLVFSELSILKTSKSGTLVNNQGK